MGLMKNKSTKSEKYTSVAEVLEKALAEIKALENAKLNKSIEDAKKSRIFSDEYSHNAAIFNNELEQYEVAQKGLEATLRAVKKVENKLEHDPNLRVR